MTTLLTRVVVDRIVTSHNLLSEKREDTPFPFYAAQPSGGVNVSGNFNQCILFIKPYYKSSLSHNLFFYQR